MDIETARVDGCTHKRGDGRALHSVVAHIDVARVFRRVLLFVLLWSSIPLVVKAQTACPNC